MPHSKRPLSCCSLNHDVDTARWGEIKPARSPRVAALSAFTLWVLASTGLAAAPNSMSSVVFDRDGVRATAYTDCDGSAYTLTTLTESGVAERYAASDKFAEKIAPELPEILTASAAWLDGDGAALCADPVQAETVTLVGVVNALPIYVTAASRSAAWQPGSAMADARDIAAFADVSPSPETPRCAVYEETVGSKIAKYRTQIFTIRAAHTTGQWSHMQALTKLVPLHQEIMGLVGDWSLAWQCPEVFALAGVAILADEERAALLKWNEQKIRARLAEASTQDDVATAMTELYRQPSLPPVSSLLDIADESSASIRYGGYLSPSVELTEALFADAAD